MRRQNPLELVFEDISTFDAETPIVGSPLREIDIKKKQSDSDFIKSLPSQPGKEIEIKKRLDRLRGISRFDKKKNNNNKNNNGGDNGPDRFGPGGAPPRLLTIQDFLDGGPALLPQRPTAPINLGNNLFNTSSTGPVPPPRPNFNFFENVPTQHPSSFNNPATGGIGNDLFGSQATTAVRESETKIKTQAEVDDFLYELPDDMPELELGDGLVQTLGTEAEDLFDPRAPPTKKEEEDEILKNLMDEYSGEDIKDTMDETGQVPESIYFFYGGEIEQFVNALEFIGLSPINREFSAFLLSDLGSKNNDTKQT